ncbi:neuferricin [Denticeps clupeoides]|uniref:Neuferricin n=1 Tax=Denticeps clupeoides TaxID=299321 RepID=A0AAY4E6D3_9TELE|nr:neuferricin [Denticeps clupeoides]
MLKYFVAVASVCLAGFIVPRQWRDTCGDALSALLAAVASGSPVRVLSVDELSRYVGATDSPGLYLAVLGQVFDVSAGRRHYGPGGGYHFFAGKDASRAFVTGDFTEDGLTDDVSDLAPGQIVALYDWLAFYQKDYTPVGRVVGRFYGPSGAPADALREVEVTLKEGQRLRAREQAQSRHYPECNSEWSSAGGRVWCSTKSGNVVRSWAGVPRMLFTPGSSSRCVCVNLEDAEHSDSPRLQEYEGCPRQAASCPLGTS